MKFQELARHQVILQDPRLLSRRKANREYLLELKKEALLFPYCFEAGRGIALAAEELHGGWESPTCQLRGHFLGHWLSAAAMEYAAWGDQEIKARADSIVEELAHCQEENGGEWAGSIPEKYLYRIARGLGTWAPHYTIHKTMMGLLDMYRYGENEKALEILKNWMPWFYRWTGSFSQEEMDNILDVETGGMLEIWACLYQITGDSRCRELLDRYTRRRLFEPLLRGEDVLTNMHANTTIPEILGAAAAYEATGEQKWMDLVLAYWDCAVTRRGQFCTGGQTCGEIWTPMQELSARLGDKNQEHCTVYHMMRLADFLFRQTGEAKYMDYWEQNLYNGIFAQGYWKGSFTHGKKATHPTEGLLTYFLPLRAGGSKAWSSKTKDFFCCHGTLVQANASLNRGIYYQEGDRIRICQYFASRAEFSVEGTAVSLALTIEPLTGSRHDSSVSVGSQVVNKTCAAVPHDPQKTAFYLTLSPQAPVEFSLEIRIPWWIQGEAVVSLNGERQMVKGEPSSFLTLRREWRRGDQVYVELPKGLTALPLPGDPEMVAFLNGPVVLAGLCSEERTLFGDIHHPETMLVPSNEREWANWTGTFHTKGQNPGFGFIPLWQVGYEPYTVYFPVKEKP